MIYLLLLILIIVALISFVSGGNIVSGYEQGFITYLEESYPKNLSIVYNTTSNVEKDVLEYFIVLPRNRLILARVTKQKRNTYTHGITEVTDDDIILKEMFEASLAQK